MSPVFSLVMILIAIAAFMYVCMKGFPPQIAALLVALFIMLTSGIPLVSGSAIDVSGASNAGFDILMAGMANFAGRYALTFLSGAIFGCVMSESGAAKVIAMKLAAIARNFKGHEQIAALWCLPIIGFILSYGGISAFVCFFTTIAVAKELLEEMDLPWRLYGCHMAGDGVIALAMMPGSPSVNNVTAGSNLGTTALSGAALGIIASVLMLILTHLYFVWELSQVKKNEEHFLPTGARIKQMNDVGDNREVKDRNVFLCLLPMILLWIIMNILKQPVWIATVIAIVVALILFRDTTKGHEIAILRDGFARATGATLTVAIITGMGNVIAATPGYALVIDSLKNLPGPGYLQVVIAVNIAAGITASSSGGLTIALGNLKDHFLGMGLNPAAVHRISTISSGGLDSLPCSGTVLNEINVAGMTPAEAYRPFGVLSVLFPIIIAIVVSILASFGIA